MASLMSNGLQLLDKSRSLVSSCEGISIRESRVPPNFGLMSWFRLTFEVLGRQQDRSDMMVFDEMA